MVIFHGYVCLPEGIFRGNQTVDTLLSSSSNWPLYGNLFIYPVFGVIITMVFISSSYFNWIIHSINGILSVLITGIWGHKCIQSSFGLPSGIKPRCEPWCWNIYLQNWASLGVNVGRYSSTMEHLGKNGS